MKAKIGALLLTLAIGVLVGYVVTQYLIFVSQKSPAEEKMAKEQAAQPPTPKALLLAVLVENAPETRPQTGLSLADIVFETVTEGGITRFLALYQAKEALAIGPVRSIRPYFVDWAYGFRALLAFSGGSTEALQKVEELGKSLKAVNEFFNEKYFWRDKNKKAPHNLFTSTKLLRDLAKKKNWETDSVIEAWTTKPDNPLNPPTVNEIDVNFSSQAYRASYKYDSATNSYLRMTAGKEQVDSLNNKQLIAKNVVVFYTTSTVIDQNLLTVDLKTQGTGRAEIFRDGGVLQARWKKDRPEDSLKLLDADNSRVELNDGPTWFAVLDQQGNVDWK